MHEIKNNFDLAPEISLNNGYQDKEIKILEDSFGAQNAQKIQKFVLIL